LKKSAVSQQAIPQKENSDFMIFLLFTRFDFPDKIEYIKAQTKGRILPVKDKIYPRPFVPAIHLPGCALTLAGLFYRPHRHHLLF